MTAETELGVGGGVAVVKRREKPGAQPERLILKKGLEKQEGGPGKVWPEVEGLGTGVTGSWRVNFSGERV